MPRLALWNEYTRKDVHAIFSPGTIFTPQAGTWGLQGIVRIPARHGDWVFFVTYGQAQGEHVFDESITEDGVLSWQSQAAQKLEDTSIQELIQHDDRINNIHLFLRTKPRAAYSYLGKLGYLTHDQTREKPVHFQWQLLDWPVPSSALSRIELRPVHIESTSTTIITNGLTELPAPPIKVKRQGSNTKNFLREKSPNYAVQDANNRALGLQGEMLVLAKEKKDLIKVGRADLANQIVHVSIVEGDSAGYDIRSFWPDGRIRFIEVKTTQGHAQTDFYISPNEIAFSSKNPNSYCLYRLYEFNAQRESAKMYILNGDLGTQLQLIPTSYRARLI